MNPLRLLLLLLLLAAVNTSVASQPTAKVGMAVDVRGSARTIVGGATKKLELLAYVTPGARIEVDEGGLAAISLYSSKSVYQIKGPAIVEITENTVRGISGNPPEARLLSNKLIASAEPRNRIHGAVRMRDASTTVALVTPENETVLLRAPSTFHWEATVPGPYSVSLFDASAPEASLITTRVQQTTWVVNEAVLQAGRTYRWSVSAGAEPITATADFAVASEDVADLLASIRPASDAPVEDWVLYATALQEHGVRDEARDAWKTIAQKRPDLTKAKYLAR